MTLKEFGKTGWQVSELSFGCMSLERTTPAECEKLIKSAVGAGINFFDTADLYEKGGNEEKIGTALQPIRHQVFVATKVGNEWNQDGSGWNWNPRKDYILKAIEKSLKRLRTDYIDLYQLHGGTIEDNIDETIEAFELLKQQGKIREYGISSIRPNVIREYIKRSSIASVMVQYSLLDRRPEETVLAILKENDSGVLVRGALGQGLLIDKPEREYLGYSEGAVWQLQEMIRKFTGTYTPQQLAMQYVLQNPAVTSVVAGIRTREQLDGLLAALRPVEKSVIEQLKGCLEPLLYTLHRE